MIKVVKFGGSSLASAEQFKKVGDIIHADEARRFVVPSAPGKRFSKDIKVTDMLYGCYDLAAKGKDFENEFKAIIIKEIYFNNLVSYVNKIEVSDRVPFARYYCDRKKLCFNFDAILRNTLIKASKHSFNSKKEKIMYLNCNIISSCSQTIRN